MSLTLKCRPSAKIDGFIGNERRTKRKRCPDNFHLVVLIAFKADENERSRSLNKQTNKQTKNRLFISFSIYVYLCSQTVIFYFLFLGAVYGNNLQIDSVSYHLQMKSNVNVCMPWIIFKYNPALSSLKIIIHFKYIILQSKCIYLKRTDAIIQLYYYNSSTCRCMQITCASVDLCRCYFTGRM